MKKVMILSVAKAIIFGIIIDLLVSSIVSIYSFDIINAFCEEPIGIPRGKVMFAVFPGAFVIIASILVAYTFLSIKSKKKES